ncbi:MAG TPA: hypothetical protein VFZ61_32275 [Polyangiales bacterium]
MATRIAWWLNLDAGLELAQPSSYQRSPELAARVQALAPRLSLLLAAEDVLLDGSRRAEQLSGFVPLCFCPTPSAQAALVGLGFTPMLPVALPLLRALTRRSFAAELGQTLPGARYVASLAELQAVLAERPSFTGEWLLKRDFSFAARERRRIRGQTPDASTLGFARQSFARGEGLQLEPYVRRLADFARHGFVTADGELLRGPVMRQEVDARGVWIASQVAETDALSERERTALEQALCETGDALRTRGYAGPFGLDAFRYVDATDAPAFQPRSEVNVRFSMGYPRCLLERALAAPDRRGADGCD